ncbi:MAG TPA: translocation/assembly module TamB domain-containing protein [Woeseiaceae bacterium]|nr:translocation/assembly module TamB domain-containing protein [Woeseiaceae bacterium]
MIARAAIYVALALLVLVLLALGAGLWLLHTEAGSGRAWAAVSAAIPGELQAGRTEGSIAGGFRLADVTYRNASLEMAIPEARITLDLDLFPPALNIVELSADSVAVRQIGPPRPEQPGGGFSLESLVLPLPVNVQSLHVSDLRVLGREGERLFVADDIRLAGRWYEEIVLSRVDIESSLADISGSAELGLHAPHATSASLDVHYPVKLGEQVVPLDLVANADGDLGRLRIDLASRDPDIRAAGELLDLLGQPSWDLRVQSGYFQWPLQGDSPAVRLADVVLDSRGRPENYSVAAAGRVTAVADAALGFSLDADGDRQGFDVKRLSLEGGWLRAESDGALRWAGGFAIALDADIERFDPSVLTAQWPAATPVTGTARAAFSPGKLELPEVRLRVTDTGQSVAADGLVDLAAGVVDLDLDWRNLRWPVAADDWRFRSDFGQVTVTGKPASWTLEGSIAFATPELPRGTFELEGRGNRDEAAVQLQDSQVLGGRIKGRVEYNWREGGRWAAELAAENIDTGAIALQWPGRISARFTTRGQLEPRRIAIDVEHLAGTLRERPVSGSGGIRYAGGNLSVEQLEITSGESRLRADGSLRADAGLDFSLEVARLGALLQGAAGSLETRGNLALRDGFPELRMDLEGRDLAWRDYRLGRITLATPAAAGSPLALTVDGQALEAAGVQVDELALDFTGSKERQRLEASAALGDKRVEAVLDGQLADWREPLAGWEGRLEALRLAAPDGVQFVLDQPARLHLGPQHLELDRACLESAAGAAICLEGRREGPREFDAAAELHALPVNLVKLFLDTELVFTQMLDGTLSASNAPGRKLSAEARLDISPGQIRNPDRARIAVRTRQGVFSLDLDDGRVLSAKLDLPFSETAAIDASFAVVDVSRGRQSEIAGELAVDLNDIGVITGVIPTIDDARGRLEVDLALAGTLAEPALSGGASLKGGALRYVPLGLKLTDIELTSRIHGDNRIDLQSTFRAGDGVGRIYSSTGALGSAGDEVRLRLTGDNLTVVDLPQVNVVANTELELGITPGELVLNGNILVPRARLSPRQIASGQVSESADVVIVARRQGEPQPEAAAPSPIAIKGAVALTLGSDVIVDFDAAQTRLAGTAIFEWRGPPMPIATGEYKVSGRFEAYGQLLEITEGSIRFPGVPASNPLLRIRAEREIFGNPRIQSAGVLVSGTAQDPELEVYTVPPTNDERALTLLVTGSDFNYEQGIGAVDVGTYVAPDLYLSYGIGLFDRENVISLRYDIAKGFGIKITSGKRAEGIDLSYTFER